MDGKEMVMEFLRKDPERFWKVRLFDELGFERKKCTKCGKYFWTLTEQEVCNDSSCRDYEFIGDPPAKRKLGYFEVWERVSKFFVERGHAVLKRFPVVCRWFPLYFTIAGIVDFYRMSNGSLDFEFPANPSVVNQVCLRFNDIPNVGINSKSYTCFGMINQQSLYDGKEGYWKDECIELDFELLTKVLKIPPEEIVFIEDAWFGANAFGACLEYHVRGLELGNAVFTQFVGTPESFREMDKKVIDMGAGWERLTWITQGTPTSYECAFGPVVEKLKKACGVEYDEELFLRYAKLSGKLNVDEVDDIFSVKRKIAEKLGVDVETLEKNIEPLQAIFSIADHARALLFALSDGGIISNVGGGYNLRVILRRALSFIDKYSWGVKLEDVIAWHAEYLRKMFPELEENLEHVVRMVEVEEERYRKSKEKGKRLVEKFVKENRVPSEEELMKLYDSEGITPEQLVEAGLKIEIPPKFYARITELHMREKEKRDKLEFDVSNVAPTEILFYEAPEIFDFEAKVVKVFPEGWVVLDKTAFYPESGGQACDKGMIGGREVLDVQKVGGVILHKVDGELKEGGVVECHVDRERRERLKKHHTATHILNAASRMVLGKHVFQHSAFKEEGKARLDITHYQALSEEEVERIEKLANEIVAKGYEIVVEVMPRGEAEQKYGFNVYQGGPIAEKTLRIVSIDDIDHEACCGTHCRNTREVGIIHILRTKRIADGVVRIEFCAGDVAREMLERSKKIVESVCSELGVSSEQLPEKVEEIFEKWKSLRKEVKKLRKVAMVGRRGNERR